MTMSNWDNAPRDLKATLLLTDEAGFSLVSPLKRSWAPRGRTPTSRTSLNHRQRMNLLGALLVSPKLRRIRLSVRSFLCHLRSEQAIIFLKQVLKLVPGDIILVWDNHKIHISPQTQEFINDHPRIHEFSTVHVSFFNRQVSPWRHATNAKVAKIQGFWLFFLAFLAAWRFPFGICTVVNP